MAGCFEYGLRVWGSVRHLTGESSCLQSPLRPSGCPARVSCFVLSLDSIFGGLDTNLHSPTSSQVVELLQIMEGALD